MRAPLSWLREYADPDLSVPEISQRLTMTGTKVEAVHAHGVSGLEHFVVGKVLSADKHPDADRLTVCSVDVGDSEGPQQIVCGAHNVAAGQTVAVGRPGSVMPDGTKLKVAKLRGVQSHGMILAEDEVGIGVDHWGIMVLDDALAAGTPLADVLPIADEVLELEITPNRPDCLAVYGVARELSAATGAELAAPPWRDDPGSPGDVAGVEVVVDAPELCPRFTARLFEDVTIGPSPQWLKARLMAAGQRPINNVVDITNYVMLLTGQPLHAFDMDRVAGAKLVVRLARDGETMVTLDDVERTLDAGMVVIDDDQGATSIAGVMGGDRSEVSEATTRVLMEAATWVGHNIQRTSTSLGLRSEASGRFEKGLSAAQTMEAQAVAASLMLELTGARLVPGTIDVGADASEPLVVRVRDARVSGLLGAPVARQRAAEILTALGFTVSEAEDGLDVRVPHFRRRDVTREADLVEEIARINGLQELPPTLPSRRGAAGVLTPQQRLRRRAEDALVGAGLHEIVGWSFASAESVAKLRLGIEPIAVENPMTEEQSVMRMTLLGSLLDAARHNQRHGEADVGIFEVGGVYRPWPAGDAPAPWRPPGQWDAEKGTPGWIALHDRVLPDERRSLAALLTGPARPASWRESAPPPADFYAGKALIETVGHALRVDLEISAPGTPPAFLHPGRCALVSAGPQIAGWVGEIHPSVAAEWDLEGTVTAFEVDLDVLIAGALAVPAFKDLVSFPAVRQDLAVIVGEDIAAERVVQVVSDAGGALLAKVGVFDVYRGAQVGEGRVSLALALEFRAPDRTLTDEEVTARREKIVAALRDRVGGELRG